MNDTEMRAHSLLEALGFTEISNRTNHNVPPDFIANGNVGIEVTRLNRAIFVDGTPIVLDSSFLGIMTAVESVLQEFSNADSDPCFFVSLTLGRPFDKKSAKKALRERLNGFLASGAPSLGRTLVSKELLIRIEPTQALWDRRFHIGGVSDLPRAEYTDDAICGNLLRVAKTKKDKCISGGLSLSKWWLVLENTVSYTVPEDIRESIWAFTLANHEVFDFWDKFILFNPLQPLVRPFVAWSSEPFQP